MNLPKLRFKDFFDTWESRVFNDILDITRLAGYEYSTYWQEDENKEIIALRGYNIGKGKLELRDLGYISNKLSKQLIRSRLSKGDIVYPCVGTIGNAVVIEEDDKYHIQQNIAKLTPKENVSPYFIAQFLMSNKGMCEVNRFNATSSQPNVLVGSLRNFQLQMPSINEQTKIANFLTAIDEKISQLTKKHELLNQYKKGVMQKIFSQELRFKDDDGSEFTGWHVSSIEEMENNKIIELGRGNVISKEDINKTAGSYPIYSSSIKKNGLFGHYGLFMFDEELITWSIDGGGDFFYRNKHRFSVTNVCGYLRIKCNKISCRFLHYQLIELHKKLSFDYQTKAHPSVIRKLYTVNIPAIKEQIKIANFLSAIDEKITATQSQLELVKQYKQGLLQQMFV